VPDLDGLVHARGYEAATVRAEGHAPQSADVAGQAKDFFPGGCVPDLDDSVWVYADSPADCGEPPAVGAEDHLLQVSVLVTAGELFPAGLRVPDLHELPTGGGEPPAVRAELDASDRRGEGLRREHVLTGGQVPDIDFARPFGLLAAGRGQAPTVRAES